MKDGSGREALQTKHGQRQVDACRTLPFSPVIGQRAWHCRQNRTPTAAPPASPQRKMAPVSTITRPHERLPGQRPVRRKRAARWLAGSLVALATAGAPPLSAEPAAPPDFAQQVLEAVNQHRAQHQLPPWETDATLIEIAAEHSSAMAQRGALSHDGFRSRFERARRGVCVENLAARYRQADRLVAGWQASPGHGENLLDARVQQVGVASVGGYVTLLACSAARVPAAR